MHAEEDHAESGFTVLEVAIALAILALSLGILYQSGASSLTALDRADKHSIALMIAESRLAEFRTIAADTGTPQTGEDPSGLHWEIVAAPIAGYPDVNSVRVVVFDPSDTAAPIVTLESAAFHAQ